MAVWSNGPSTTFTRRAPGRGHSRHLRVLGRRYGQHDRAYRWNGGANGSLGTTSVASSADCRGSNVPCRRRDLRASNTGNITTPWITAVKAGRSEHHAHTSDRAVLRGRDQSDRLEPRREVLQYVHRRHALVDHADRDPVRLRGRLLGACTSGIDTTPKQGTVPPGTSIPAAGIDIRRLPAPRRSACSTMPTSLSTGPIPSAGPFRSRSAARSL